jgi:hypothetical protein
MVAEPMVMTAGWGVGVGRGTGRVLSTSTTLPVTGRKTGMPLMVVDWLGIIVEPSNITPDGPEEMVMGWLLIVRVVTAPGL